MKEEWKQLWVQFRKALSATLMALAVKVGPKPIPACNPFVSEPLIVEEPVAVIVEEPVVEEPVRFKRKKK